MEVIKNAIDPSLLRALYASWPKQDWRGWHRYKGKDANKYGSRAAGELPSIVMPCVLQMIDAITDTVDMPPYCFPDLELYGAGLHMLPPRGYLRKHLDSSYMESTGWKREYSCVLGVNPDWDSDIDGGDFVLNDQRVPLEFNQLVIFRTNDESFHEVLDVTGDVYRKTLCVFYWSEKEVSWPIRHKARFYHD